MAARRATVPGYEKGISEGTVMDESQLRNVWRNRQRPNRIAPLSQPLDHLVKHQLARRVRQVGQLSAVWDECIPDSVREHTALLSFRLGTLTVAVDSAAHRYQLQTLLQSGLLDAIRERFAAGALNRVRLVPGQFDSIEMPDRRRSGCV